MTKFMSREETLQSVGPGWSKLVNRYWDFIDTLNDYPNPDRLSAGIVLVDNARGMLHIVAQNGPNGGAVIQEMVDKLAWAIERDSAKVCEKCGKKGFRRKNLPGTPNRCRKHYIELANDMAERGEI